MECKKFEEMYWLKAYGETPPGGDDGYLDHFADCPRCQAKARELDRLHVLLAARERLVPNAESLQAARLRLSARLRTTRSAQAMPVRDWLRDHLRLGGSPAWGWGLAAATLLLGLFLGRMIYFQPVRSLADEQSLASADLAAQEKSYILENVLRGEANISDLRVRPSASEAGAVQVNFRAAKDYVVSGSPDDQVILELLGWAVKHEQNSGVRLQSVQELSRASNLSPKARQVLAYALINDQNDGVRLKSLEALEGLTQDELVEQAVLKALLKDPNPAVRIRAIDALLARGSTQSESMVLMAAEADSNDYVRLQAQRAIRESQVEYPVSGK